MNKKGFTLIEVLVSLAIVSAVLTAMFSALVKMRTNYNAVVSSSESEIAKASISRILSKDINNSGGIKNSYCNTNGDECNLVLADGGKRKIKIQTVDEGDIKYKTLSYIDSYSSEKLLFIKTLKMDSTSDTKQYTFGNMFDSNYSFKVGETVSKLTRINIKINDNEYSTDSTYDVILSSTSNYDINKVQLGEMFRITFNGKYFYEEYGVKFADLINGNELNSTYFGTGKYCVKGTSNVVIQDGELKVTETYFKEDTELAAC